MGLIWEAVRAFSCPHAHGTEAGLRKPRGIAPERNSCWRRIIAGCERMVVRSRGACSALSTNPVLLYSLLQAASFLPDTPCSLLPLTGDALCLSVCLPLFLKQPGGDSHPHPIASC